MTRFDNTTSERVVTGTGGSPGDSVGRSHIGAQPPSTCQHEDPAPEAGGATLAPHRAPGGTRNPIIVLLRLPVELSLRVLAWVLPAARNVQPKRVCRILVYSYTSLGDFIMFTPALIRLRETFPGARITLQEGRPYGARHVLEGTNVFDDTVWFPTSGSILTRLKFILRMRRRRYDLVLSAFDNSRNRTLAMETFLSGARYRVGHVGGGGFVNKLGFVFNVRVPIEAGRHDVDLKCDLVEALGIAVADRRLRLFVDGASKAAAERLLAERGVGQEFVCVIPGAANHRATEKRWAPDKFAHLVARIGCELQLEVVILGDGNEVAIGETIHQVAGSKVHMLAGKTSIKEAAAIIHKARLLVCNDSGLMHVGVAMGTPLVAVFGPTDYRRTGPRGENYVMVRRCLLCTSRIYFRGEEGALDCCHTVSIDSITVDEVFAAVKSQLSKSSPVMSSVATEE